MPPKIPAKPVDSLMLLHAVEIDLAAGATEPPKELRLFPAGVLQTTKGPFKFSASSAQKVMAAASERGVDMPFDYHHAMDSVFQLDPATANRAAGWFKPAVRNGELWATDIRWTPTASKMLMDREYRYISPTFTHKDGEVSRLLRAAITNDPATKNAVPIMASAEEEDHMDPKTFAMLGLKEGAESDEIAAAIAGLKVTADKYVALAAEVETMKASHRASEVERLVKTGQEEGKLPPAMVDWAKAQTPEALSQFLKVQPKVVTKIETKPAGEGKKPDPEQVELTAAEREVAEMLGQDLDKVRAHKAERIKKAASKKRTVAADEDDE